MSKYTLQVQFDRPDRIYRFEEEITGKVVLETQTDLTCRKIWIEYGWRTHGKGNRDQGVQKKLILSSEITQFQSSGHREYFFKINAPNGPVTYHGHILNIDWYVTGHADIPRAPDKKNEQDFLLLACDSPGVINIGNKMLRKDELPIHSHLTQSHTQLEQVSQAAHISKNSFKDKIKYLIGFVLYAVVISMIILFTHNLPVYAIVIVVLLFLTFSIAISLTLPRILSSMAKAKVDIIELRVVPSVLYQGDILRCYLQFQTKRSVFLDKIVARLWAEETAISGGGTAITTHKHQAYKKSFAKPYTIKCQTGKCISFDCELPVLLDAPVTFNSSSNSINWYASVKLRFSHWPSWEKVYPITVLPG